MADTWPWPGLNKPPAREGISWRKVVLPAGRVAQGEYVAARAGDSPRAAGTVIQAGDVLPTAVPAWLWPGVPDEPVIPFDYRVLSTSSDFIAVDKPHFLPVTSNGRIVRETVQTRLRVREDNPHIAPVHRLDQLTSGVVLCSTNPRTRAPYQQLFERRQVEKTYRAVVRGEHGLSEEPTTIALGMRKRGRRVVVDPLGKQTVTLARALSEAEVELRPLTGHTHQLRVVMNHLGAPIVGDDTYPVDTGRGVYDFSTPLELRAISLKFHDPVHDCTVLLEAL